MCASIPRTLGYRASAVVEEDAMHSTRRDLLRLTAAAAALPALAKVTHAQSYPSRAVRVIVPYPPGGPADIVTRPLCALLAQRFGQPFATEYKPGAGSNLGTEALVHSHPDGYTLLMSSSAQAINATLYRRLDFNFIRDTVPVASVSREALIVLVAPSFPAKTVAELIAYAKAHPRSVLMGSAGNGTTGHVAGELFQMKAGIELIHVPYRGGMPALTALLGGHVQVLFTPVSGAIELVRTARLPALAVTTAARLAVLPDIPTVAETVHSYEASYWNGVVAPKGTPSDIVTTLNSGINASVNSAQMATRFAKLGIVALPASPTVFGKLIIEETQKWAEVVRFAKITVT